MIKLHLTWEEVLDRKLRSERWLLWAGSGRNARIVATLEKTIKGKWWRAEVRLPDPDHYKEFWPLEEGKAQLSALVLRWFDECVSDEAQS